MRDAAAWIDVRSKYRPSQVPGSPCEVLAEDERRMFSMVDGQLSFAVLRAVVYEDDRNLAYLAALLCRGFIE